jgi:indolepyruvate ferredoxin oxidoreductase beta subunit
MQSDDPKNEFHLTCETAKHLANAMSYDDVIRVADLKTRKARNIRINKEMGINGEDYLKITEFLHPRAEEIVGMLPNKLGFFIEQRSGLMALIERVFSKKRLVRTDSLLGFIQLYFLGGLRTFRRRSYRYKIEQNHIDNWLSSALSLLPNDYNLALEVIRARRLIKGYGDTHSRGLTKFDRVIDGISLLSAHKDSAYWAQKLQTAALDHEDDIELKKTLQNIRSLS